MRRAQGVRAYDVRVFVSTLALLRYLHRLARARRGRAGATVATSMPQLVAGLAPIMGWERSGDRFADRDAHHSSVRRWLRWLQAAGLVAVRTALNDAGEEARTEITLLALDDVDVDERDLAAADARLRVWARRYGPAWDTGAQRCLPEIGRRAQPPAPARRRREGRLRAAAVAQSRRTRSQTNLAPPFGSSSKLEDLPSVVSPSSDTKRSCSARAGDLWSRDPTPKPVLNARAAMRPSTPGTEDGGGEPPRRARWAVWEQRIAAAEAVCERHPARLEDPLPDARALRLALAARRQGVLALAAGEPADRVGPRLARRLRRAARAWIRWRTPGEPDPAAELLRRAEQNPDLELGELVRAFAVAAKRRARRARADRAQRLDAAHRRATRQRDAILAAWPDWLQRDGDRLVLDPGDRFIQVHRLPPAAVLASRGAALLAARHHRPDLVRARQRGRAHRPRRPLRLHPARPRPTRPRRTHPRPMDQRHPAAPRSTSTAPDTSALEGTGAVTAEGAKSAASWQRQADSLFGWPPFSTIL